MPVHTLLPNGDGPIESLPHPNGVAVVGSVGMAAALFDNNLGTYVVLNPNNDYSWGAYGPAFIVAMSSFVLTAGEVVKSVTLSVLAGSNAYTAAFAAGFATNQWWLTGHTQPDGYSQGYVPTPVELAGGDAAHSLTGTPVWYTSPAQFVSPPNAPGYYSGSHWTQADIDNLNVGVTWRNGDVQSGPPPQGGGSAYIYEIYATVLSGLPPTVAVTAPSGSSGISNPVVSWTYTQGTDGSGQTAYRVKVFTAAQYSAGGFDPETSIATWDSGVANGSAATRQVGVLLANGTFRAYVKVAQTTAGITQWSPWSFSQVIINVPGPGAPTVTAVPDPARGAIDVTVVQGIDPPWQYVQVQRSIDGGVTWVDLRDYTLHPVAAGPPPVGSQTQLAQVALINLAGRAGTVVTGVGPVIAQVATITLRGISGTVVGSATSIPPHPALMSLSAVSGIVQSGGVQTWQPLKIGAGGYITGIDISADGVGKYIRTDTYGAYRLVGSLWKQLVTDVALPVADRLPNSGIGCYEIAVAPSSALRVYMAWYQSVYVSNNGGDNWTETALQGKSFDPNDNSYYRICGRKMIVDPANPDVCYFGAPNDGLWFTTNAGTTWTAVAPAQVPVATFADVRGNHPGYMGMAFDPSGGVTSGRTNNIYVWSAGHGLYRSTNQGVTWTNLTGGPDLSVKFIESACVDPTNGVYYCIVSDSINVNPTVWRYTPSTNTWFLSLNVPDYVPHGITINPNNHLHIVTQRMFGGGLAQSNDAGATWDVQAIYPSGTSWSAPDVPWLGIPGIQGSGGDIRFDPVVANKMWIVEGIAPWFATVTYGMAVIAYTSLAAGIEQLVVNKILTPPGFMGILVAVWDRGTFLLTNLANYPSTYKPSTAFDATWDIDYSGAVPAFIVANHSDNQGNSLLAGYSNNGGASWTTFPSMPLGATNPYTYGFGDIAVSTDTNHIVWLGAPNQWPYFSANKGTSWAACSIPLLVNPTDNQAAFIWSTYLNRHVLTSDKVTPNIFYLYVSFPTDATKRGFYKSTDGGASFARVGPTAPITADISSQSVGEAVYWATFNAQLQAAPGNAGHLWFTPGAVGSNPDSLTADGYAFLRSTDGGATWSTIANVKEVYGFGFGKDSGTGYPAIFIVGWVSGVYGVWRSYNQGAAWTNIGTFPYGVVDYTTAVVGDMDIVGRCYVGFRGSGCVYRDS